MISRNFSQKAIRCLSHPVSLLAMVMIIINALFLQKVYPSWLSGKLGDLGWMIVLPLVLTLLLSLLPSGKCSKYAVEISVLLTAVFLTLFKLSPWVNQLAQSSFTSLFGTPLKLALDPTDLLVLPALLIPIMIWHGEQRIKMPVWRYAAIGLVALSLLADAPLPKDRILTCLAVDGTSVVLFSAEVTGSTSNKGRDVYISTDDGRTWQDFGKYGVNGKDADMPALGIQLKDHVYQCNDTSSTFEIAHPSQTGVSYMFMGGKGIYISTDNAVSFTLDRAEESLEFFDAVFTPTTGDLIIAVGTDGLLIRSPEGEYCTVRVDQLLLDE
jgi:hypothetical protein